MKNKDHPDTSEEASRLLQRAYSLKGNAEAQELYAAWAKTYDQTMLDELGYLTPKRTAQLLGQHVQTRSSKVLDVGSGTGLAGMELSQLSFMSIDGLDYSPEMLEVAKSRDIYDSLIKADLNLPLGIESVTYDALICTGTFTHAHVGAGCLPKLFRILKPGGIFACTIHKQVWEPAGFAAQVEAMHASGFIQTLHHEEGKYYSNSDDPEGWYIVWQKAA